MNAFVRRLACATMAALGFFGQHSALSQHAWALGPPTLIPMDDLPNQPVNGLVHPAGVTFGFTVAGVANTEARYNSGGPGNTAFIDDPSIEGPASQAALSFTFLTAATTVDFGLAMSDVTANPAGALVQLYNPANVLLSSSPLALSPLSTIFIEGHYSYSGLPVRRAVITLQPGQSGVRFVIDNLEFTPVPEPTTAALIIAALVAAHGIRKRRTGAN